MSTNNNISAVIIAFNEEKYIQQCIKSILPVTTNIIVVDSGSTDNTVKLATEAGAEVHFMTWEGYGNNKNFGNSKAKYDWILSIDADEMLDSKLQQHLLKLNKSTKTIYKIKSLVRYNGKWIKHCGWYPAWKLRFFHKSIYWNLDPVHETLIYPNNTNFEKLDGHLYHFSYDSIEQHRQKSAVYGKLKAESWIKKGEPIGIIKQLFGPTFKFLRTYIFKLGILDGREGLIISRIDAEMIRIAIRYYKNLKGENL